MRYARNWVAALAALFLSTGCIGEKHMSLYFEGTRPAEDVGPNQATGAPLGLHYRGLDKGSNPRQNGVVDAPPFLAFDDTGKVERVRLQPKPNGIDEATKITVFLIQSTSGSTFDPASGFMEFPISLYKADGVTLLGTTTTHIPNDYDPTIPPPTDDWFEAQAYEFDGLTLDQDDIDDGLILELDSSAADGWTGGGTWFVYAAWTGTEFSLAEAVEPSVIVTAPIHTVIDVYAPIETADADAPIETEIEISATIDTDN